MHRYIIRVRRCLQVWRESDSERRLRTGRHLHGVHGGDERLDGRRHGRTADRPSGHRKRRRRADIQRHRSSVYYSIQYSKSELLKILKLQQKKHMQILE